MRFALCVSFFHRAQNQYDNGSNYLAGSIGMLCALLDAKKKKKKKDLGKTNAWNKKQNLAGECKSCLHGVREIKPLDVKVTRE